MNLSKITSVKIKDESGEVYRNDRVRTITIEYNKDGTEAEVTIETIKINAINVPREDK